MKILGKNTFFLNTLYIYLLLYRALLKACFMSFHLLEWFFPGMEVTDGDCSFAVCASTTSDLLLNNPYITFLIEKDTCIFILSFLMDITKA